MQDYKLVIRSVVNGATVKDEQGNISYQNIGEFLDYLQAMYLNTGYELLSVDLVNKAVATPGVVTPIWYEFAYHLVKNMSTSKG